MTGDRVRFYFDFISPYSYLAASLLERRTDLSLSQFDLAPVALGSVFSELGVRGPGDVPYRRRHGLSDVLMLAELYSIPFEGPPKHPFNSLYALRAVAAAPPESRRALSLALFRAAWGRGEDLEQPTVLRAVGLQLGLDFDPEEVASRRETRRIVKDNTKELLLAGGFGVPTFRVGGRLLFGHDRLDLLAALLAGSIRPDDEKLERLLSRPHPQVSSSE